MSQRDLLPGRPLNSLIVNSNVSLNRQELFALSVFFFLFGGFFFFLFTRDKIKLLPSDRNVFSLHLHINEDFKNTGTIKSTRQRLCVLQWSYKMCSVSWFWARDCSSCVSRQENILSSISNCNFAWWDPILLLMLCPFHVYLYVLNRCWSKAQGTRTWYRGRLSKRLIIFCLGYFSFLC